MGDIVNVLKGFDELIGIGLALLVVWIIHELVGKRRSATWRVVVSEMARRYHIAHRPAANAQEDVATGEHEGIQLDVRLSPDEHRPGRQRSDSRCTQVEARSRAIPGDLRIVPRRSHVYQIVDYAALEREGSAASADELGALIEIRGANQAVLDALREREVYELLSQLAAAGLLVRSGELSLSLPGLPRSPDELAAHIDRLLYLSKTLAELQPR